MTLDTDRIKLGFKKQSDEQLTNILIYSQDDYNPAVIPIIESVLLDRGISADAIAEFKSQYQKFTDDHKADVPRLRKADFFTRAAAYLIDCFICAILLSPLYILDIIESKSLLEFLIVAPLYFALTEGIWSRSFGMMLTGIKVVSEGNFTPIAFKVAWQRAYGRVLSLVPVGYGFVSMIWDKNKQTWHDKSSKTLVIANK